MVSLKTLWKAHIDLEKNVGYIEYLVSYILNINDKHSGILVNDPPNINKIQETHQAGTIDSFNN